MTHDSSSIIELGINDLEPPDPQSLWVDMTEEELEDDPKYQAYLAFMDQDEFQFVADTPVNTQELGITAFEEQKKNMRWTGFLNVRAYWHPAIISLLRKWRHFGRYKVKGMPWCEIDTCQHQEFSKIYIVPTFDP